MNYYKAVGYREGYKLEAITYIKIINEVSLQRVGSAKLK